MTKIHQGSPFQQRTAAAYQERDLIQMYCHKVYCIFDDAYSNCIRFWTMTLFNIYILLYYYYLFIFKFFPC